MQDRLKILKFPCRHSAGKAARVKRVAGGDAAGKEVEKWVRHPLAYHPHDHDHLHHYQKKGGFQASATSTGRSLRQVSTIGSRCHPLIGSCRSNHHHHHHHHQCKHNYIISATRSGRLSLRPPWPPCPPPFLTARPCLLRLMLTWSGSSSLSSPFSNSCFS